MKGRLVTPAELTPRDRSGMFALCARHFAGVTPASFGADLAEKNHVLLLEEADGTLSGFSTLHYYAARHRGAPIRVVYSGDTIVDPAAWGRSVLSAAWIGAVRRMHHAAEDEPLWWLLLVSGFRTYRVLPLYWPAVHPRFDGAAAETHRPLRNRLATARFGGAYDPETGIARLPHPMVLRPSLLEIPPARRADPHVRHFLERNPGHTEGDELVCLTELAYHNLTSAGRRIWSAGEDALVPAAPSPASSTRARERAS